MAWRQAQWAMAHPVCSDESPGGANPVSHAIREIGEEGNTVVSPDVEEHPKEAECHKQDSNARGNISLPVQPLKVGTIEPVGCNGLHVSSWHSRCWLPRSCQRLSLPCVHFVQRIAKSSCNSSSVEHSIPE